DSWATRDRVFAKFHDYFSRIRILEQNPRENVPIAGFTLICSLNERIRVTKIVQGLCSQF
ncbi:hypothetical protein P691DRAFT_622214, partial [Macrolepiota fuliginosa MF-IS2]